MLWRDTSWGAVGGIWQARGYEPSGSQCEDQKSSCLFSVMSFPECGHRRFSCDRRYSERGWLYPEAQSRAGTFSLCPLQPSSCGTQRGPITCSLACPEESHVIASKGDILAQITIVKRLSCPRDCAHVLSTFSCFILTPRSEVGTIICLCFHSRSLRHGED